MRVYAVTGVPPEIQAYAMAKYSRSAQSMQDSISELSAQRAEEFLNTFYFAYGHRSIADLAHLSFAVEDISILAAIRLVDEPVWDGQERSTRYQDFRKSGYVLPMEAEKEHEQRYREAIDGLFAAYHHISRRLLDVLVASLPRPAEMTHDAFRRTLRARAFDVARYLLPLATRTSVGQITSARVLERQIGRLLADPLPEMRAIGEALRAGCGEPPADITRGAIRSALNGHGADPAVQAALVTPPLAPTLVKYAQATPFASERYAALAEAADCWLGALSVDRSRAVELAESVPLDQEIVATLLYRADRAGHSYRQAQAVVRELSSVQRQEIIDLSFAGRGQYDEWLREHQAGHGLAFDLLIDAGAFRDLHRHRRCVQIVQPFTTAHGHDQPLDILRLGLGEAAESCMEAAGALGDALDAGLAGAAELAGALGEEAAYLLPLGTKVRALFKMDPAQAAYMIELRTGVTGHFSYRHAAWGMFEALRERFPALAGHVRATDPRCEVDLLRR